MKSTLNYLGKLLILFALYFITAKFGLQIDAVSGFATLVWLPTGISLAALIIFGLYLWPAIALGAFLANYLNHAPPLVALGIAVGNTLEAVVAAYILKRVLHIHKSMDTIKDVLGLVVIAATFCTLLSATIGVASLYLGNVINEQSISSTWTAWWIGDMVSNLIIAPVILVWYAKRTFNFEILKIMEKAITLIILLLLGLVIFEGLFGIDIKSSPLTYLVFPPLIWIALRFTPYEAITATALFSFIAIWGTAHHLGPFNRPTLNESLLYLDSFIAIMSISAMTLAASVAEKRHLEQQKNNFISIASHELKTPITSIKAYSQILSRIFSKRKNKELNKYIKEMNTQVNKLTRLINDLLDLSHIQTNRIDIIRVRFSLNTLVRNVAETARRVHKKYKIVVKGSVSRSVFGDQERIEQVLLNLINNAVKYSPGTDKIVITLRQERNVAVVGVQDYGIGISEEYHEKIFDYFYRVEDKYTKTMPGSGIGLYISKNIIANHGGKMWVESEQKKGSTFYFSLPSYRKKA